MVALVRAFEASHNSEGVLIDFFLFLYGLDLDFRLMGCLVVLHGVEVGSSDRRLEDRLEQLILFFPAGLHRQNNIYPVFGNKI
jgi:hypothetical protein